MRYLFLSICAISILNSQQALSAAAEAEGNFFSGRNSPKSPSYDTTTKDGDAMSDAYSIISESGAGESKAATSSKRRKSKWETMEEKEARLKAGELVTPLLSSSSPMGVFGSPSSSATKSSGLSVAGSPGFSPQASRCELTPDEVERRKAIARASAKAIQAKKSSPAKVGPESPSFACGSGLGVNPPALCLPSSAVIKSSRRAPYPVSFNGGHLPSYIGAVSRVAYLVDGKTFIHRESPGVLFIGATTYEVDARNIVTRIITGRKENLPYGYSVHHFIEYKLRKIERNNIVREKLRRLRGSRLYAGRMRSRPTS